MSDPTTPAPAPASEPAPASYGAPSGRRRGPALSRLLAVLGLSLLLVATLVLLAGTFLGFAARQWWIADLSTNFRIQLGLALGVCGLLLAAARQPGLATLALLGGAFNMIFVIPAYLPAPDGSQVGARPLRAILLNVGSANTDYDAVTSTILKEKADVAMLFEVNEAWVEALDALAEQYPQNAELPRDDSFGMAIYSRFPLTGAVTEALGLEGLPAMAAEIDAGGGKVKLVAAHPPPPVTAEYAAERNRYLADLTTLSRRQGTPQVLCGDLNTTQWSPYFADLAQGAGLRDGTRGHGIQPTWSVVFPRITWMPIDHCLVSPEVGVRGARRGPKVGSDHLPLIVELAVPPRG